MEFKITAAEALEMARFEEEVGCDLSAGPDWGIHLDKVIEQALTKKNTVVSKYLLGVIWFSLSQLPSGTW